MRAIIDHSRPAWINGVRVVVHVPFTGERDLFKFTPNTRNYNPPQATVSGDEVQVVIEYPTDAPRDVKAEAENVLNGIEWFEPSTAHRKAPLAPGLFVSSGLGAIA
jgi:hypothetical protein